jgi:hypothetical protein
VREINGVNFLFGLNADDMPCGKNIVGEMKMS